jgi:transposase
MPRGAKTRFTPAQDEQVAKLYRQDRLSTYEIGRRFGTSDQPIRAALRRQGVTMRQSADYAWQPTPENRAEIVQLWRDGLGVQKIGRRVHASNRVISRALAEEGIQARFGGQNRRFKDDQVAILVAEHLAGVSASALARRYGGSNVTVRNALRRAGVQVKAYGHAPRFWTAERLAWLRSQHLAGRTQQDIAAELGYSQAVISRKLRDLGLRSPQRPRRRSEHPSWKGGRHINRDGYALVYPAEDELHLAEPHSGGRVFEHRLVMARHLGRPLLPDENVHHKKGNADNAIQDLELWTSSQPKGRRVDEIVEWATEMLRRYAPDRLASESLS